MTNLQALRLLRGIKEIALSAHGPDEAPGNIDPRLWVALGKIAGIADTELERYKAAEPPR